jgi:2-polyprenyl-6-methoxyphenol hydroxylase-like FAD-dependent oxidoreductase
MSRTEVLVVGAGPVGLALAAELARRGVQPRIIDQAVGPSTTSKAIAIQPRTLEIFRRMGIVDEVLARGFMVGAGNFYSNGRTLARIEFRDLDSPYGFIVDLPQNETEEVLLEHLARRGVEVERDTRMLGLEQDDEGVSVQVIRAAGNEAIRCSYLVGCDGAYSTVRHALNLPLARSPIAQQLLLADMNVDWLYPHELHVFLHADGFLSCFPLPGGHYRFIADVTAQEPAGDSERAPRATPDRIREIVRHRADAEATVSEPTWLAGFRIRHQAARQYSRGRVFVAGDAAHVPSPAGGQGMNTGIQDACNLAWKIQLSLRGHAAAGLLESYTAEREPVGRHVVALSDRLTQPEAAMVDRSDLLNQISEIGIDYRESPIVAQDWQNPSGPLPGDRAPLIDGLNGVTHHLLLFTGNEPDIAALSEIGRLVPKGVVCSHLIATRPVEWEGSLIPDRRRVIHERFGAESSCLYLIRPDGYIGYRASPPDPARLGVYLSKVFRS